MRETSCSSGLYSNSVGLSKTPSPVYSTLSLAKTKHRLRHEDKDLSKERDFIALDPTYRSKQLKKQRKQDIQKLYQDKKANSNLIDAKTDKKKAHEKSSNTTRKCKFTFVFDPNGRISYWMSKSIDFIDLAWDKYEDRVLKNLFESNYP
jgi:hypothetical protein